MLTRIFARPLILLLLIQGAVCLVSPTSNATKGCCCQTDQNNKKEWDWAGGINGKCKKGKGSCVNKKFCKDPIPKKDLV